MQSHKVGVANRDGDMITSILITLKCQIIWGILMNRGVRKKSLNLINRKSK